VEEYLSQETLVKAAQIDKRRKSKLEKSDSPQFEDKPVRRRAPKCRKEITKCPHDS
jgi:hypothetical protein